MPCKPTKFHLAYMSSLESTFPPLFRFFIDNRDSLFADGDTRVASLLLWHYIEEIEHRSSAVAIYDAVVGDPWYRLRVAPRAFAHMMALFRLAADGFAEHVPAEDLGAPPESIQFVRIYAKELRSRIPGVRRIGRNSHVPSFFYNQAGRDIAVFWRNILASQTPHHDPATERVPDWFDTWVSAYEAGEDMAHFYGTPPEKVGGRA